MALNFMPFLPPQASPQAQAATRQAGLPPLQATSPMAGGFRQAKQDWRSQRPEFMPGMERGDFRTQMQDWRGLRPQRSAYGMPGMEGGMGGGRERDMLGLPQTPQMSAPVPQSFPTQQPQIGQPLSGRGFFGNRMPDMSQFLARRGG